MVGSSMVSNKFNTIYKLQQIWHGQILFNFILGHFAVYMKLEQHGFG